MCIRISSLPTKQTSLKSRYSGFKLYSSKLFCLNKNAITVVSTVCKMFKFGFSQDDDDDDEKVVEESNNKDDEECAINFNWFSASEIQVTQEQIKQVYTPDDYTETELCDVGIKIILSENVVVTLTTEDHGNIIKAESQHSDLLPAVYEGGLKIWECSYDLGRFLIETGVEFENKKVLDLGCGAGIIGLLALLKGSSSVHFQDYNTEVMKLVTIPNVLLNLEDRQAVKDKCEFYCGDWASFAELSSIKYPKEEDKYDLILTSETIYNPANQEKLYDIFKKRLKNNGVGFVAGKTYYFGVGGGMRQFETLVKEDRLFDVEVVWKSTEGLQREIIMLKRVCQA